MDKVENLDNLDKLTNSTFNLLTTFSYMHDYADIDFLKWLIWLFTPVVVSFFENLNLSF